MIAIPKIQPPSATVLATCAEIGDLCPFVPSSGCSGFWYARYDLFVSGQLFKGPKNFTRPRLDSHPLDTNSPLSGLQRRRRLEYIHAVTSIARHIVLRS